MGIGFVLLIWLTFWMTVASVSSIILGFGIWLLFRRAPRGPRVRAVLAVTVLPPSVVVGAFVGFFVYAVFPSNWKNGTGGNSTRSKLGRGICKHGILGKTQSRKSFRVI